MRHRLIAGIILIALALGVPSAIPSAQPRADTLDKCRPGGSLATIPDLPEASGIAVSRRVRGRLWSHNDSGEPLLLALDTNGAVTGRVRVTGAEVEDREAVAVGTCPEGSCIYVADIGDNDGNRRRITVYQVPEPAAADESATVSRVFHATYPDGKHDAEALLVTPAGSIYVVTKGDPGPVAVYRFPAEAASGTTGQLQPVATARDGRTRGDDRITDGGVSPDGESVVLRSNDRLMFFRSADLLSGTWRETGRVDVTPLGEPQGEAVAFGTGNTIYLAGEGGGKSRPGTFASFACTPPR